MSDDRSLVELVDEGLRLEADAAKGGARAALWWQSWATENAGRLLRALRRYLAGRVNDA